MGSGHKLDEATLSFATVPELCNGLRQREFSAVELTKFFSRRLEDLGPQLNALAFSLAKSGHGLAKDVDGELKQERFRGSLQGIPYAVKDLFAVAKHPTTWGAKPYADQVFDFNASVVDRLNKARAILIGKLSMIELAGGGDYSSAAASLQGPCLNPWNKSYWAGGSSSGSGAAVAAGLVPFALGSETSGSVLCPASYCGVTGLRPTYGLVSRHGAMPLSWTLDKVGVLAHSAEDCALVLHEIAGGDSEDPSSSGKSFHYTPRFYREMKDLKIGFGAIDFSEWPQEPLKPVYANAFSVVKSIGAQMVETKLPDYPYRLVIGTIIDSEAASVFEDFIRSGKVDQLADRSQIEGLKASLAYSAVDYLKAMRIRSQIQTAMREVFANVDLLVAPGPYGLPDRADQPFPDSPPVRPVDQQSMAPWLVQAGNLCGLPAISIPCGFVNGLPLGLHIVGPAFGENQLLAFARAFQERTDFHKQHPNLTG